jgi:hypothetical protein
VLSSEDEQSTRAPPFVEEQNCDAAPLLLVHLESLGSTIDTLVSVAIR